MKLKMKSAPGAILRVIGLAERRGYDPLTINAEHHDGDVVMHMTVKANRPIQLFVNQAKKLFGMMSVEVMK